MRFQLLKPLRGWREFFGEVGVIVLGVLIALGAQQLIERRNWQVQVRQANDAFKTELLEAAGNAYERLAVQRCLQDQLRAIAGRLNEPGSDWRGMPEKFKGAETYYSNVLPVVYRPPGRASLTDAWRNALADDTIDHLDGQQARNLSQAYAIIQVFNDFGREEATLGSELTPLSTDRTLGEGIRIGMLQTVSRLDGLNNAMVTASKQLLEAIRVLHLRFDTAEVRKQRGELFQVQRNYRGQCVRDLPLDLN